MKNLLKAKKISLTESEAEILLRVYNNDIVLGYEDGYIYEYWIGTKGTTALQLLLIGEEEQRALVCFGKTVDELRRDATFIDAILNDPDVNHALGSDDKIQEWAYKEILDWLTGKTSVPPITACGAENYYDDYLAR